MKTLKTLFVLMAIALGSFAGQDPNTSNKLSMDFALKTYLDAVVHGKLKGFSDILDSDVKFTLTRADKIIHYSKFEMLSSMKVSENVNQNCQPSYAVVEQHPNQAIVKVQLKYSDFSRINYVTFTNTNKGWKITNVSSSFI